MDLFIGLAGIVLILSGLTAFLAFALQVGVDGIALAPQSR